MSYTRYLAGYAIKMGGSLFYYTDGHYSDYVPVYGIHPGTLHVGASEAIRALKYAKDKCVNPEVVRVKLVFEPVDMSDLTNNFNKERIEKLRKIISEEDIKFIKENM